jgi:hypothetical protein
MSQAEKQALALRDLALIVAKAKGVITAPDVYSYQDARIRMNIAAASRTRSTCSSAATAI